MFRLVAVVLTLGALAQGCAREVENSGSHEPARSASESTSTAGGASAQVLSELRQHEAELTQFVEQGRLDQVHGKVETMTAFLGAVPDRATDLPASSREQLRTRCESASRMAEVMHEAADSGDLSGTKTHLAHLQSDLSAIESLLAGSP